MSGNPKRYLNLQKEAIYKKYKEDQGDVFLPSKTGAYRISDEIYNKLFTNMPDIPEGHLIKGKSTLYDKEGNTVLQWVKTGEDKEQREKVIQAILEGINSKVEQKKPTPFYPKLGLDSDIINQYTITDYHLGMMAWHEETGDDWDLDIAEEILINWFRKAIELSPNSENCIFAQIGDLTHTDGFEALTPASKHLLDVDTRFPKLVRSSIRILKQIIDMLLDKHKTVYFINASGNHDPVTSVWIKEVFSFYYENEPRIIIDTNPDLYYCHKFGKTLLFYHHGHKRNISNIETVFVSKFKEHFSDSKNVYGHLGHLHHAKVNETNLMTLEQHRTLAAKDSYASGGGWMSGRDSKVITYHKEFGEVARSVINIDMIKRLAE